MEIRGLGDELWDLGYCRSGVFSHHTSHSITIATLRPQLLYTTSLKPPGIEQKFFMCSIGNSLSLSQISLITQFPHGIIPSPMVYSPLKHLIPSVKTIFAQSSSNSKNPLPVSSPAPLTPLWRDSLDKIHNYLYVTDLWSVKESGKEWRGVKWSEEEWERVIKSGVEWNWVMKSDSAWNITNWWYCKRVEQSEI